MVHYYLNIIIPQNPMEFAFQLVACTIHEKIALVLLAAKHANMEKILTKKWQVENARVNRDCAVTNFRANDVKKASYTMLMFNFRLELFSNKFIEQFILIEERNFMVKNIVTSVTKCSDYVLFGGFVRDYVKNGKSLNFMTFNDFDVKCCRETDRQTLISKLEASYDIETGIEHIRTIPNRNSGWRKRVSISVVTYTIIHKRFPELHMSMDIVVDSDSFFSSVGSDYYIRNKMPDFDVNQLYFSTNLGLRSMIPWLPVESIIDNINKNVFTVFSDTARLCKQHHYAHPGSLKPEDNADCVFRSRPQLRPWRDDDNDDKYADDILNRGKKIQSRIAEMQSRGWKCLTCQDHHCENPLCIFSKEDEYQREIKKNNKEEILKRKQEEEIKKLKDKQKKLRMKLTVLQIRILDGCIKRTELQYFPNTLSSQTIVFERKEKARHIEKTKKRSKSKSGFEKGKKIKSYNDKVHSRKKHTRPIIDYVIPHKSLNRYEDDDDYI